MRAARKFAFSLAEHQLLSHVASVQIDLYGSLALTGTGHGTDRAVLLGLSGEHPRSIDPSSIESILQEIRSSRQIKIAGQQNVAFEEEVHLLFHKDEMNPPDAKTQHPNGLRFTAKDSSGNVLAQQIWFSVGGGFIALDGEEGKDSAAPPALSSLPYPFCSAQELLELGSKHNLKIWQLILANEVARRTGDDAEQQVKNDILSIWQVMQECVQRGMTTEGILPGGLNVRRRAPRLVQRLKEKQQGPDAPSDPLAPLDWVSIYAMAVNEENAAGGRVVTAPTNGAAGIIPAVAHYYMNFVDGANEEGILRYFLTSAAIGILYKENASISGAEVGCQGEVGVACSMAAGGLVAAVDGTNGEVEHAAEIAMEHNLGMTCDPIGGLVQIPCIERNAMGSVKAVHASRMARNESESHKVSLDQVIRTMYLTGLDMQSRYKETSLAGLALNIIEC